MSRGEDRSVFQAEIICEDGLSNDPLDTWLGGSMTRPIIERCRILAAQLY